MDDFSARAFNPQPEPPADFAQSQVRYDLHFSARLPPVPVGMLLPAVQA